MFKVSVPAVVLYRYSMVLYWQAVCMLCCKAKWEVVTHISVVQCWGCTSTGTLTGGYDTADMRAVQCTTLLVEIREIPKSVSSFVVCEILGSLLPVVKLFITMQSKRSFCCYSSLVSWMRCTIETDSFKLMPVQYLLHWLFLYIDFKCCPSSN